MGKDLVTLSEEIGVAQQVMLHQELVNKRAVLSYPPSMIHVDPITLTFQNLDEVEVALLRPELHAILFKGTVNWDSPFLKAWLEAGKFEDHQRLIVVTAIYVPRALYSLVERLYEVPIPVNGSAA